MNIHQEGRDRLKQYYQEYEAALYQGYEAAFINTTGNSNVAYKPEFISNNFRAGEKVLSAVEEGLQGCDEFIISVAFITDSGIEPLMQTLHELELRNVRGRILTTDYLQFSEPKALERLHQFPNIELRMFMTDRDGGFHTKGYLFRNNDIYRIIVGSSNLTAAALTRNKEWNTCLYSKKSGIYAADLLEEFNTLWDAAESLDYDAFIEDYRKSYKDAREQRDRARRNLDFQTYTLRPNSMQKEFCDKIIEMQRDGKRKALLISATGTGKTYASAFALREQNPRRVLFLVHREQIARQARESYQRVFDNGKSYGLLSGDSNGHDEDYLFATMQTMSQEKVLHSFDPKAFTTIVIDEVHKAGAKSYQKIMDYFQPDFWLGMTATPERSDKVDIYQLFDHNIAYEIRLQKAMEEDLLCPFHYFGITDILTEEGTAAEVFPKGKRRKLCEFNDLMSDQRVDHIIRNAEYYGYSGDRVKGLIFVSRNKAGEDLSARLNEHGLRTVFLSGKTRQEQREHYIRMLETDDPNVEQLDYILTVDIFNEGVDIPQVNQVLLLRPTTSPIIFVQQLGRGLRKAPGKEYVVIIDFIGNYTNNYMIPIALSGDRSYNKDNMRRYVTNGCNSIPGSSTVHFDEVAREQIYKSIDTAQTDSILLLKEAYRTLKQRLGRIPSIVDYGEHESIDVQKFISKCGSYYDFLVKYEPEYKVRLDEAEREIICFISQKLSKGKRREELWLLKELIDGQDDMDSDVVDLPPDTPALVRTSVENVLTNQFLQKKEMKEHQHCVLIEKYSDGYALQRDFYQMLIQNAYFSQMVLEILYYGLIQNQKLYEHRYRDTNLVLNQKYTYEDVTRLLNWPQTRNGQSISGYMYNKQTKTLPVFINYDKSNDAIQYKDRFEDPEHLIAHSKKDRKYTPGTRVAKGNSSDVYRIYKWKKSEEENRIFLFVRKNKKDKEAKEFYFLGEVEAVGDPRPSEIIDTDKKGRTKKHDAFEIKYRLYDPVRKDIYEYITQ